MKVNFSGAMALAAVLVTLSAGAVSAAAAKRLVYIPLGSAAKVVVVDVTKGTIVREIKGLPAVHGLAATPDGRFLIAGSFIERDAKAGAPKKPAGMSKTEHEEHHAKTPKGAAMSPTAMSTITVVQTADGKVVRRIDVPGAVHHVTVRPDGKYAVVTQPYQGTISVIDLALYQVVSTVKTGAQPNYAVFGPDGTHLYVSNAGDGTISQVDARNWTVLGNIKVGKKPEHMVVARDGKTLFVNNVGDGSVSVVSMEQGKVTRTISIGAKLHGIDISDDGKTLFVAALGGDKMTTIDLSTWAIRPVTLSPKPYHLAVIRGSGKVYVSSADRPTLWVIDQRTLKVTGEIKIGGKGHQMAQASAQ